MTDFVFRDDVPLPNPRSKNQYPDWSKMKVGQSVLFKGTYNNVKSAARYAGKRHNMKFAVRNFKKDGTVGVWRIA